MKYVPGPEELTKNQWIYTRVLSETEHDPNFDQEAYYANTEQQNKKQ